ncbi:MBL fold metallo-hydrolase [Nigerium massiliense]|uniref:MBL fold metallo-hydrolase n=1 Tax=Nigerium massiliense TaxID=1522317 RepID=UPI001F2A77DC|nr:MBL fold metallo-hydrolase [Nigerium massiliense]
MLGDKLDDVLVASFLAGALQANCYLVGADGRDDAVVIDPGEGAADGVATLAAEHGRRVVGVLLTHGHVDHVAAAADVADASGVPCWLHEADRELLDDPAAGDPMMQQLVDAMGVDVRPPRRLELLGGGETIDVAGLSFHVVHAPGHRPGCVLFRLGGGEGELIFSGDVVFAGSIGRTDLPGGDPAAMLATLKDVVLPLPDAAAVLPGHGPATTVAHERATNPSLQPSFLR